MEYRARREYGKTSEPAMSNGVHTNGGSHSHSQCSTVSDRLKSINSAMSWIRGELDDLKESDRSLMEIFKQLEGNVADLSLYVSSWRNSNSFHDSFTPDSRPMSLLDLDNTTSHQSSLNKHSGSTSVSMNSLESTLTSSKEEVSYKTSSGSESRLPPEVDSGQGSSSYSPALSTNQEPVSTHSVLESRNGLVTSATITNVARPTHKQLYVSPQLKGSASLNKIFNRQSPNMLSKFQDETGSGVNRNSSESIDSGIQFENGNGGEATTSVNQVKTVTEPEEELGDFASDLFAMLGLKT